MLQEKARLQEKTAYLLVAIVLIMLLATLGIGVFGILAGIKSQLDQRLTSSLETVLDMTDKALQNWVEQTEINVSTLAESHELLINVEAQLRVGPSPRSLLNSPALRNIRRLFAPTMRFNQFPGFAVIAPDGTQIAAQIDAAVGIRNIGDHDAFVGAMAGKTSLGLPFRSRLYEGGTTPIMTAAAPIRDDNWKIIAVLALRLDPRGDFSRAVQIGRLESTGETYAFDRNGLLLTESRYTKQLRQVGLIPPDAESILNLQLRDPGGNTVEGFKPTVPRDQQPLTRMARNAIAGNSGIDLHGYRDYRGVPVIGAWLWDNQLGMGLAIEIDRSEAFAPYRRVRKLALLMLLLTAVVSVVLLLILRHRDRLLAANESYKQALRARDDMMAVVSHDLKNPLNTMMLRSKLMLQMTRECSGLQSEQIRHNLELLQGTARHMNQLVSDLTDSVKIHADRLHLDLQECTLQEAVETALERMRLLAREKGVEFATHVTSEPTELWVDPRRITQVLDNLLGNALKFTPENGRVVVDARLIQNAIQVSVADTGPGIPKDALSRIFEPYWQVQKTRSGMGLGLFIAKTLIEAHAGRIWVESAIGRGTTFYFTLPTIEVARHALASEAEPDEGRLA